MKLKEAAEKLTPATPAPYARCSQCDEPLTDETVYNYGPGNVFCSIECGHEWLVCRDRFPYYLDHENGMSASWHGGQWTGLYSICSMGRVENISIARDAIYEIEQILKGDAQGDEDELRAFLQELEEIATIETGE